MALKDYPSNNGLHEFIKGLPDWHEPLNANFAAVKASLDNKADNGAYGLGAHGIAAYYDSIYGGGFYRYEPGGPNSLSGQFGGLDPNGEVLINANWDGNAGGQIAISPYNGIMGYRTMAGGPATWTPWVKTAIVESPAIYQLAIINENFIAHPGEGGLVACEYSKDQFDIIRLNLNIQTLDGQDYLIPTRAIVAVLPVGFRPAMAFSSPITIRNFMWSESKASVMSVSPNGNVEIFGMHFTGAVIHGQITFPV